MAAKVLDGRYKLVKKLGSGGFGHTYIARDMRRPGTPLCVVKHLKPASNDADFIREARRLFSTEAETLERLGKHDQIPQLLAYFEEDQHFFLVQEYIEGKSLHDELKLAPADPPEDAPVSESQSDSEQSDPEAKSEQSSSNSAPKSDQKGKAKSKPKLSRKVTEPEAIAILKDILEVLEFVHSEGVIHRDIKPENLIRRKSDRKLVLIDFGAVKAMQEGTELEVNSSGESRFTVTIGTPGYMPNEQCAGRPAFSSDIFAAGMVVIKALTGLEPIDIESDPDSGELLWRDKTRISNGLAMVLTRMVRYQYNQRYQSARETMQALNAFVVEQAPKPAAAIVKASTSNSSGNRTTRRTVAKSHSQSNQGGWLIAVSLIAVIGAAALSIPILLSSDQKEPEPPTRSATTPVLPSATKNPNPAADPVAPPVTTTVPNPDSNNGTNPDAPVTTAVAPVVANTIQPLPIKAGEQTTTTGVLNPGQNLSFTLSAKEGQELNANLAGESVYMTIVNPDNQALGVEANNTSNWAGNLPDEGEYQLQLTTSATEAAEFTLTVALGEEPPTRTRTINVEIKTNN
jgi:serine/threonine protein kinase